MSLKAAIKSGIKRDLKRGLRGRGGGAGITIPLSGSIVVAQERELGAPSNTDMFWVDTFDNGNYALRIYEANDQFQDRPFITSYDITGISAAGAPITYSLATGTSGLQTFQVANNGLDIFAITQSGTADDIFRFRLNTAYDVNSGTNRTNLNNGDTTAAAGFALDLVEGQKFLVLSRGGTGGVSFGANHQLANPFDTTVSLTSITPTSYVLPAKAVAPENRLFAVDVAGNYAIVGYKFSGDAYHEFDVYEMSTPWDANTASLVNTVQLGHSEIDPAATTQLTIHSIQIIPERNEFYICSSYTAAVNTRLRKLTYG